MQVDEFRNLTADLENIYAKKLNSIQVQMWFDELKHYSADRYKKAVHKIYTTQQYFPSLSIVLDTIKNVYVDEQAEETEKYDCKACLGTGYILYKKLIEGMPYEYMALCNCPNAKGKEYDGRKCEKKSYYYIPKAEDVFGVS